MAPVAKRLSELLGKDVILAKDIVGEDAKAKAAALKPGQILLLENLRYDKGETKNDPAFAKALADLAGADGIYVSDAFRTAGMETEVYTPFVCGAFTELFSKDKAVKALDEGKVVFFAGGTGHPYFSTDTATALRAIEIEADVILLAKSIDGVYDSDPAVNENAVKYDSITMEEVLDQKLGVIDLTATIMCLENKMPLAVFGLNEENSIENLMKGEFNGTYVTV